MPNSFQHILEHFCPPVILTAYDAGAEILRIYHGEDFEIQLKADNSPLTAADKAFLQQAAAAPPEGPNDESAG